MSTNLIKLPKRQIVHLHSHTEYSLLDGVRNSAEFIKAAKAKNMDAYAITEHGNMASAMGFYLEAIKPENNIKPIFGMEAYVIGDLDKLKDKDSLDSKSSHLVLIARNEDGFRNLLKISNLSWNKGFYYKPKVDFEHLRKFSKGVTALTACMGGVVSSALRYSGYKAAREKVKLLKDIYKDQLYLEIQMMEEVYFPDLKRVKAKIEKIKDESIRKQKLKYLKRHKDTIVEVLEKHLETKNVENDYYSYMHDLLGDSWLDQATVNKYMLRLSKETKTPIIVTGDCHYPNKGDHKLQDFLIRVGFGNYKKSREGTDEKSKSTGRGYYSSQLYVKSNEEFDQSRKKWHPYLPRKVLVEAIKNTHKIADQVDFQIPVGKHQLPVFDLKSHKYYQPKDTKEDLFHRLIAKGFKKNVIPNISYKEIQKYRERLKFEEKTIKDANFIDYFLIIEDIVQWSRKNNIHCVARGSVAGSLVAYALEITGIDPIPYHLLFERFLNPTRVSGERAKAADALPDIDLDFERNGRNRVKKYIIDKYGKDRVLTIGSYGTFGVKGLVRDFVRTFEGKIGDKEFTYQEINSLTSDVDMGITTIEEACQSSEKFSKFYEDNKGFFETYIRPLVGNIRSFSKHAAGVLITPTPFTEWVPVRTQAMDDEETDETKIVISQWEDTYCERRGLLKLDILGVKQLDVFHRCLDLIKQRHKVEVRLEEVDRHDKNVFKKFHKGDTFGVFQFNSNLQSSYMKKMKPDSIEDLSASNSLLRPGPMHEHAHEHFVSLKKGEEKPEYDHPVVIPYLKSTFGLMIYQEQIMQVANVLGGLSLAEADMMRSAIKKKDEKLMDPFRDKLIKGCKKKGLTTKRSEHVWEKILAFSGYGFNLSHSTTYALEGYYCQWLKTYFPKEFYAATLEFASDDVKKNENIYTHRQHAMDAGAKFFSPSVNKATLQFELTPKGSVIWPIRAIKGVGEKAATIIQKYQPYKSFDDFIGRVEKRIVNKRVMMNLITANCFSDFGKQEEILREYFKFRKEDYPENFENLNKFQWSRIKDNTLGFVSKSYKKILKGEFSENVIDMETFLSLRDRQRCKIGGIITKFKEHKARNGKMCFMTIEDMGEKYEVVCFASVYERLQKKPKAGKIVQLTGTKGHSNRGEIQLVLGDPSQDRIKTIA